MENESVNKRISHLINDYEKRNQKFFAEKIGVSPSAVSSLFSKRENKPGLEMLQKIAVAYPEIRIDWLLVGRGPMLNLEEGKDGNTPMRSEQPAVNGFLEPSAGLDGTYVVVQAHTGAAVSALVNQYLQKGYRLRGPLLAINETVQGQQVGMLLQNLVAPKSE